MVMIAAAAAAASSRLSLDNSTSNLGAANQARSLCQWFPELPNVSFGCKIPLFGARRYHWLSAGHNHRATKISVAADFSDSVPDSSSYASSRGYHPLEELKSTKRMRETELTSAEIARTTVEANNKALLVFPGIVHSEPYEQTSWAEYRYIVDDYGDMFFEIFDDENILDDRGASNPVNVLIGIDIPTYQTRRVGADRELVDSVMGDNTLIDDEYYEIIDAGVTDALDDWREKTASSWIHPLHFAKCMKKAIDAEFDKKMEHPCNGVSFLGCLRPAFIDEESYLRRVFFEESDGYNSDWKDSENSYIGAEVEGQPTALTIYRMEVIRIELFSVYGVQSIINLQDFQDAEPDHLVRSTSKIMKHFSERVERCGNALKALCKKKGILVEKARLIGVDSLGMDVRVSSGCQLQTHRFPFKSLATSAVAAEKQIQQLLFPKSRRKRFTNVDDQIRDRY